MVTVYGLKNECNGKHYIGCTAGKPQKRWREHRCLLRNATHRCAPLQTDWASVGESSFCLVILEVLSDECSISDKRQAEFRWMDLFADQQLLYNEYRISYQPPPGFHAKAIAKRKANGYRPSPESNLKRRLSQLGIPKGHGAKISATKQAKRRDSLLCIEKQDAEASDKEPMR